ncbi:MAG: hypothetical protein U1E53_17510 [Dongiaceae bacterium]
MTTHDDPCNRSKTEFEGGTFTNSGVDACRITITAPTLLGSSNLRMGFDVPSRLVGEVRREKDVVVFEFDPAHQGTPVFWIDDKVLNNDWGGAIKRVTYASVRVIVTTQNGCILYNYPPAK